ncbi:hypothetical protein [Cerasicoccus fimbriatus]|uniref:hypothetical protein n=1 Tax=Cerasicoccus fimbriatus TaxID=3014554 RepID=UPI0022B3A3BB|nr:hypothetical protein [Cerasicoccus sp. TK19100]
MFPRFLKCATWFAGSAMLSAVVFAQANDEPRPEEVIPIGPGYLTKGYKTMINGQVVETTDGRTYSVEGVNGHEVPMTPKAQPAKPVAPQGNWPAVVTIVDGVIVDPETMQEVSNLPAEIELIPMGLKKISTNQGETTAPMFRIQVKNAAPVQPAPSNQHPASMGPDFSGLLAAQEEAEPTEAETEAAEETEEADSGGGLLDFLFGSSEPQEEELEEDEMIIDLSKPLTQAEMEALKNNPEFQQYLQKQSGDRSRNFYSSKGRGKRSSTNTTKPPSKIVVEKFNPEEWEQEASISPTPNIAIGKLVSVDTDREIAVCWLQTRYIRANMPMVTRNYELQTTGVLLPAGEQDGRAAGFWIAQGNPAPGDEVIVPGPDYQGLIQPWVEVLTSTN